VRGNLTRHARRGTPSAQVGPAATLEERTIDITTMGRRSRQPRRIEIVFYRFEDSVYLSGIPAPRPRSWLLNLSAEPRFVFHLKHAIVADLPATATIITDAGERRRIFSQFVDEFNRRQGPDSPWPHAVLDDWVEGSPLALVTFDDTEASELAGPAGARSRSGRALPSSG
jgi:deazaflavin-dependent oxidoreductase (nitroreductase family)